MSAMHAEDRPYQTTAKDAEARPVREELSRIENAAGLLDERLDVLISRLDPVLVPGFPIEAADRLQSVPTAPESPVAGQLRTIREHLSRIESRIEQTLTRLQV